MTVCREPFLSLLNWTDMTKIGHDLFPRKQKFTPGLKPKDKLQWYALADALLEFARRPTTLHFSDFADANNYSTYKLIKWFKNNENDYFTDRVEMALAVIGSRRENESRDRSKDNDCLKKKMAFYDLPYADHLKEMAAAKGNVVQVTASLTPQEIAALAWPSSDKVPLPKKFEGTD